MTARPERDDAISPAGNLTAARPEIAFRPVTRADLELLSGWMRGEEWRKWWGDPDTELAYIRAMIDGRDTSRPFLFEIGGRPMGYIQYWFVGDHQCEPWLGDSPWLAALPADAVGVDLSIGPPGWLSRGIGSAVLGTFAGRLVAEGRRTIIIDPDPSNARAVRAYEKAGFRIVPELLERCRDCVIMRFDRLSAQQEPQLAS